MPEPMKPPPMPPTLAERPFDDRRGVPVPYMNVVPAFDGEPERVSFDYISAPAVMECAEKHLCGICARPLGYWIAFLGGPKSFTARAYVDPPFHPECAEFAMTACPHIAVQRHTRAPDHRTEGTWTPTTADLDKAQEWVMGLTRSFKVEPYQGGMVFRPAPFKRSRRFGYVDGEIAELT